MRRRSITPGTSTEANWLLSDRLGTVRTVTDSCGGGINTIAYDGFGNIVSRTDSSKTGRYTFASREKDYETGFYSNRARYYDPPRWGASRRLKSDLYPCLQSQVPIHGVHG